MIRIGTDLLIYIILGVAAVICGCILQLRKNSRRLRVLRDIIRILYSMDSDLEKKLAKCNSVNSYSQTRYLPMALYLENIGVLRAFPEWSGPTTQENVYQRSTVGRLANRNPYEEELEKTLSNYGEHNVRFYNRLVALHDIIRKTMPRDVFFEVPREAYFLDLNILNEYCKATMRVEYLSYDPSKVDAERRKTYEFIKRVLNQHYKYLRSYIPAEEHHNPEAFTREMIDQSKEL